MAKLGDLLLGPLPIAGHRAICQPLEDVLSIGTDVAVVPEIKGELHSFSVALLEQRLDVPGKTGYAVSSGHDCAPFPFCSSMLMMHFLLWSLHHREHR